LESVGISLQIFSPVNIAACIGSRPCQVSTFAHLLPTAVVSTWAAPMKIV
jgi:hypothetical protein